MLLPSQIPVQNRRSCRFAAARKRVECPCHSILSNHKTCGGTMSAEAYPAQGASFERLRESVAGLLSAAHGFDPKRAHPLMSVTAVLCSLRAAIAECERWQVTHERILNIIGPARELYGQSPFVRRLQQWPRGSPGDFET